MKLLKRFWPLLVIVLVLAYFDLRPVARADSDRPNSPSNLSAYSQYMRAGIPVWGKSQTFNTSTAWVNTSTGTAYASGTTNQDNHPQLFPFGTIVSVSCDVTTTLCFTQDWNNITLTTNGWVEDAATSAVDGIGACFRVTGGAGRVDAIPTTDMFILAEAPTRRTSYCVYASGTVRPTRGWPCNSSADCVYGPATCTALGQLNASGAFLAGIAAATASCFITTDR